MFEGGVLDDMDERNNPSWLMSPIYGPYINTGVPRHTSRIVILVHNPFLRKPNLPSKVEYDLSKIKSALRKLNLPAIAVKFVVVQL